MVVAQAMMVAVQVKVEAYELNRLAKQYEHTD